MKLLQLQSREQFHPQGGIPSFEDHCLFIKKFDKPAHFPEHYTGLGVVAIIKGKGHFFVNDEKICLDENAFCVVNRGSRLSFDIIEEGTFLSLLYFDSKLSALLSQSLFHQELEPQDFTLIEHIHFMNASLKNHFNLLIDLGGSCASFHHLKTDMLVRSILEDIISENLNAIRTSRKIPVVKRTTRVDLYKRLSMARGWLEQHYYHPIQIEQLANIAMLNSEHFLRLFKKAFGITPHQLLINLRIQKAKSLLEGADLSIAEICHKVGYESISSFSGLFKQKTGYTPSQYRKK